jgi:lipoate-protein ligase A
VNAVGSLLDRDFLTPVIRALARFGVTAAPGRRRELLVDGYKISGTAAHLARGRQLFHGTLLHDTDPKRMRLALNGDKSLRGKHVASVPSETANLKSYLAEPLTTDEFLLRLAGVFRDLYRIPAACAQ